MMIFKYYIFHSNSTNKWTTNTDSEWETPPVTPRTPPGRNFNRKDISTTKKSCRNQYDLT